MKRLILSNLLLLGLGYGFIAFNSSLQAVIHFPELQSFFTRLNYFVMFVVGLIITIIMYVVFINNLKRQQEDTIKKVLTYELLLLYVIAIPYLLLYTYTSFFGCISCITFGLYQPYPWFGVIYILEILFIIYEIIRFIIKTKEKRLY